RHPTAPAGWGCPRYAAPTIPPRPPCAKPCWRGAPVAAQRAATWLSPTPMPTPDGWVFGCTTTAATSRSAATPEIPSDLMPDGTVDGTVDGGDPLRPAAPPLRSPRSVDGGDPLRPAAPPLRSPLRLATWNVNSIRSRLPRVLDWLARADVDVLAMQETKCSDSQFPTLPFFELGYEVAHVGFNQWNGVAIASRVGLDDVQIGFDGQATWSSKPEVAATAEARALGATCGGVRLWSLYVPNGRALGDPHYAYKLDWLAALRDSAAG